MDENAIENIRYKFELKKLKDDGSSKSNDANRTEIFSDPLDNLDLLSPTPDPELKENKVDKDISYSVLYGNEIDEAKLIEENVDLYNDLVKIEEEERKARQTHEMEFENLKKQLEKFRESDHKNKARIEELTKENSNLKTSLSSLYRTVKREIEFKDKSLEEANNEIIKLKNKMFYKSEQFFNGKCPNCENNSIDSKNDANTSKRKRPESPEPASRKRECKLNEPKIYETDLQSGKDKRKTEEKPEHSVTKKNCSSDLSKNKDKEDALHKQIPKTATHNKETQASNQCLFCQSHQNIGVTENLEDSRGVNDVRFNLLPDAFKKSFNDYKQDLINSLNRLKDTFVDQYFNSGVVIPSSVLSSTPKRQDVHTDKEPVSDTVSSPGTTLELPTSSSQHCKTTESGRKFNTNESDENEIKKHSSQNYDSKVLRTCSNSRINKREELPLNKSSENISLSRMESTPTSSPVNCKRTELVRRFKKNDVDKNEVEKDDIQDYVAKIPKNCFNLRRNKKEELVSNKGSKTASPRTESNFPPSFEYYKRTELDRKQENDELSKYEAKKDYAQNCISKDPTNSSNSRQNKKEELISKKSSKIISPRIESKPSSTFEHCKRTELNRKEVEEDKYEVMKHSTQSHISKDPTNSYNSRQNKKEELISNESSKTISPRTESTLSLNFEHCKRAELDRKAEINEKDESDKHKAKKHYIQNHISKEPTNNSRLNEKEQLISSKSSKSVSPRIEPKLSPTFEHCKRTELNRKEEKNEKGELDKHETKKLYIQNHISKDPTNTSSQQKKKDIIRLFAYRKEKIPFVEKKKFELDKDDQKLIPKKLL